MYACKIVYMRVYYTRLCFLYKRSNFIVKMESADMNSVIGRVTTLEAENKALTEKLQERESMLQQREERLSKYTDEQRAKMKEQLDTMIKTWLDKIDMSDEKVKDEFMSGMEKIVKDTKEDSNVWQIMCSASKAHLTNVNQLNEITEKYNELQKQLNGGNFRNEDDRIISSGAKRKLEDEPRNIWDDFESMMKGGGAVASFVPDPETVKNLRSEWKPV